MNESVFQNEWFGKENIIVEQCNDYSVITYKCNGSGIVINYELFPGINLVFMDFNSPDIFEEGGCYDDIIEIRHCNKGRIEFEFKDQSISHLQQDEFCINASANMSGRYSFPFEYCSGVSLVVDKSKITSYTKNQLIFFDIDISTLCDKLELHKQWFVCKTPKRILHIFDQLYQAKCQEPIKYLQIKVIELLYYVMNLKSEDRFETTYYSKKNIQIVKRIRNKLISDLGNKISLNVLIGEEGINMVTFQAIFKQIYGDSAYAYLKSYKMNCAAVKLKEENEKINQIAISLGYNNASKFSKAFKDVFGVLPKDYRNKLYENK